MNEEQLRARFWKITSDKDEIVAQAAPLRAEYEKLRQEEAALQARQKAIADQFKVIEAPLFEIDMERSRLSRSLGGKVGQPPK